MRNILLIDDLRVFRHPVEGELHIARNCEEAFVILKTDESREWDEIWFDHDLGMVNGKEEDTLPVADYLAERAFFGCPVAVKKIFIHTSNSVGGNALIKTLRNYGYPVQRVDAKPVFDIDEELYWTKPSS